MVTPGKDSQGFGNSSSSTSGATRSAAGASAAKPFAVDAATPSAPQCRWALRRQHSTSCSSAGAPWRALASERCPYPRRDPTGAVSGCEVGLGSRTTLRRTRHRLRYATARGSCSSSRIFNGCSTSRTGPTRTSLCSSGSAQPPGCGAVTSAACSGVTSKRSMARSRSTVPSADQASRCSPSRASVLE